MFSEIAFPPIIMLNTVIETRQHVFCVLYLVLTTSYSARSRGPCDPLVPQYCMLPFPNSFYTKGDPTSATGYAVHIEQSALPPNTLNKAIDPQEWNDFDGFSPFPSIVTYFPGIASTGLPPHWDIQRSLTNDSSTIILDTTQDKLIAHFAELDNSLQPPIVDEHALMLWPSQRLNDNTHYVVAVRRLYSIHGNLVQASDGFRALRDGVITNNSDIEYRRSSFEKYFVMLEKHGVHRSDVQIMWDFTTASKKNLTNRLVYMRDDALSRVAQDGFTYELGVVTDHYSEHIYRRIIGAVQVPLYLTTPLPGSHLVINPLNGLPIYQDMAELTFTILIPYSVYNGSAPTALLVQYGHGLFTSQNEVETDYLQRQADRYGYVLVSCDTWGLFYADIPSILLMLIENTPFRIIPDRLTQGIVNELLLMRFIKTVLYDHPLLRFGGKTVIDPAEVYYYGVSLGGIIGDVYMAATTDVDRGVLGVPGGPFGLLLPRSSAFTQLNVILRLLYPDPVEYITVMSAFNMVWSRLDPNAYMSSISNDTLPGTPQHQVLYQYALGDSQVSILGLYSIARSANAKIFSSSVKEKFFPVPESDVIVEERLFGLELVNDTIIKEDNVAVGFDCGAPPEPGINIPPNSATDTHEKPRRAKLAQQQIDLFIRKGVVQNFCNGPCNDCTPY